MTADATGEPQKVMCPACGKVFTMARFYGGKGTVACPWCLAAISVARAD